MFVRSVFVKFASRLFVLALVASSAALPQQQKTVAMVDLAANLPAQKIGPNDLVMVTVYDAPEFTRTIRVGANGEIRLPMLKRALKAAGLMPNELEASFAEALKAEQLIVDPMVTVTVLEYHSRPISVAGEVKTPITFQAIGQVSLLDAITKAGGLTQTAGPEILVSRTQPGEGGAPATLVQRIPVKGLIDQANPDLNLKLSGGEEIRVPEMGRLYVVGNVKKPGAFPVRDSNDMTVLQSLALAEGLSPFAGKVAYIYRRGDGQSAKNEIPIELRAILDRKSPDVPLQANDILYVPDNKNRRTTLTALEKILAFSASTISGVLIYSTIR